MDYLVMVAPFDGKREKPQGGGCGPYLMCSNLCTSFTIQIQVRKL
jgi:hypothetical protein